MPTHQHMDKFTKDMTTETKQRKHHEPLTNCKRVLWERQNLKYHTDQLNPISNFNVEQKRPFRRNVTSHVLFCEPDYGHNVLLG